MTLVVTPHSLHEKVGPYLWSDARKRLRTLQSLTSSEIRLLATPPGVAGFVMPGKSRAVHLNLYMALFSPMSKVSRVIQHEDLHLRHQEIMQMEIPFFNQMQDVHMDLMVEIFWDDHPFSDLTELIEWFTEGAIIQKVGSQDEQCPYTFHEVPKMQQLETLVQIKSGKSVLQPFRRMNSSSRNEFLSAMRDTINTLMIEKALYGSIDPYRSSQNDPDLSSVATWYRDTFPDKVVETSREASEMVRQYEMCWV